MAADDSIRILFLASEPNDAVRLRLGQEIRDIREKLQLSQQAFVLESREAVRPGDVTQAIFEVKPQIIHFSGHGLKTGEICFEDAVGKVKPVTADSLAALFKLLADQIDCVILNACYSATQAKAIAKYIPYVIGMNQAIGDKAAIAFSVGFYKALGANHTIEKAYKFGCVEIQLENIPEHLTPVLEAKNTSQNTQQPTKKLVMVLSATIDELDKARAEAIVSHLRFISKDVSLTLEKVEEGSIRITLSGTQEGLQRLQNLFNEGQLTQILGIPVENVEFEEQINEGQSTQILDIPVENVEIEEQMTLSAYTSNELENELEANRFSQFRQSLESNLRERFQDEQLTTSSSQLVLQSQGLFEAPLLKRLQAEQFLVVNSRQRNGLIIFREFYAEFAGPGAAVGGFIDSDCTGVIPLGNLSLVEPRDHEDRQKALIIRRQWIRLMQNFTDQPRAMDRAQMILDQLKTYFYKSTISQIPDEAIALMVGVLPETVRRCRLNRR